MLLIDWRFSLVDMGLIVLSLILGSAIGYEREAHGKSAGLRTHALVSVGATLLTIVSMRGFGAWEGGLRDPVRIVGQIVAGIGFLCAGTILRDGLSIKGLTTAASLWTTCMVGIVVGTGLIQYGILGAVIVVLVLGQFSKIESRISVRSISMLKVVATDRPGLLGDIGLILGKYQIGISKSEINSDVNSGLVSIDMELRKPSKDVSLSTAALELNSVRGIRDYEIHE